MKSPIQVVFRNVGRSDRVEQAIREKAEKLEKIHDRITACRVTIEMPHKHHTKGNTFEVSLNLSVPEKDIVVKRTSSEAQTNGDEGMMSTVRDAFDAAKRQLEEHTRKRRGETKSHEAPPSARITQLFQEQGYGFLETVDGREIYFHSNALVDHNFDDLRLGSEVVYTEQQGVDGPQASTVRLRV